jgi:hypothetical protein
MRLSLNILAAILISATLSALSPMKAEAGAAAALHNTSSHASSQEQLTLAGYYGGGHGYDYEEEDEDGGDYGYHGYKRRNYHCGSYVHYEKKYVCEQTEPRCFKQRECIWSYGREYCRYVRKCIHGEKYCRWISVPVKSCGCGKCW